MSILGSRIKDLRKRDNMTQKNLGELVNVTKVSICCYENGTRLPSLEILEDLAEVFKVSVDYLLGRDTFVVSDNVSKYSIKMATEEVSFIKEIRKYDKIHELVVSDPKRTAELIYNKLK